MGEHPFMPVRTSFHTVCLGVKHPSHRGAPWCNGMLHGATVRQRDVGFAFWGKLVTNGLTGGSPIAQPLTHLTHGTPTRRPLHPAKTATPSIDPHEPHTEPPQAGRPWRLH